MGSSSKRPRGDDQGVGENKKVRQAPIVRPGEGKKKSSHYDEGENESSHHNQEKKKSSRRRLAQPPKELLDQPPRAPPEMVHKLLDLTHQARPAPGDDRVAAMVAGDYVTPYRWEGDTYENAGRRPEPHFPKGWKGWDDYNKRLAQLEDEYAEDTLRDTTAERAQRAAQRAQRRGRSPEFRQLD